VVFISRLAALFMSLDAFSHRHYSSAGLCGRGHGFFFSSSSCCSTLRAERLRKINWVASAGGVAVALALLVQIFYVIGHLTFSKQTFPPLAGSTIDDGTHRSVAFRKLQSAISNHRVLVLVATIGAVLLSKRERR